MPLNPYLGQISMFAGNFAPHGWALCNGQLLSISQNSALFSLLGTFYGGNGTSTFALPDLRSRAPIHQGAGAGLSQRVMGEFAGVESVALILNQLPSHSHGIPSSAGATNLPATQTDPEGHVFAVPNDGSQAYASSVNASLGGGGTSSLAGNGVAHSNLQPYQCVNFIIATVGVYPTRN